MFRRLPHDTIVTYKYSLHMTHIQKPVSAFLGKFTREHLDQLWDGKFLVLISPIYHSGKKVLVHPTLDIDTNLSTGIQLLKQFFSKNQQLSKYWFVEYTGKNSFHLYFSYLVLIDDTQILSSPYNLRSAIMKFIPKYILKHTDIVSSIRNIPILRIGYRPDTNRMALPIIRRNLLDVNILQQLSQQRTLSTIFKNKEQLVDYLQTRLIPPLYTSLNFYYKICNLLK